MSTALQSLEKVILPLAIALGKQPHINAIKNGFIKLMPLTLVGAMCVLINNVFLSFGEGSFFFTIGVRLDPALIASLEGFKGIGGNIYNGTLGIMALMAPFFIAHALAEERKVDPLASGLIAIAAFLTLTPFNAGGAYAVGANWLGGANIISGMLVGLVVAEMFAFIIRRNWVITLPDSVPETVSRSFSALIPGFVILFLFGVLSIQFDASSNFHQMIMDSISKPLANVGGLVGWVYIVLSSFLWFFGIHGMLALTALEQSVLFPFTLENVALFNQYGSVDAAIAAGESFHFWAKPIMDSFVFLGGTGATLGLILAIFMVSRRDDYRQVAKLGLPSGVFQINEPLLFGLPIIMNPILVVPFLLVHPVLMLITMFAYHIGFIPPITNIAPWTMPTGLAAFFNTNGSISAFILAIFNLGVATAMYIPFVLIANKAQAVVDDKEETNSEEEIALSLKF
ncbi:MAG: PTS N,N'-diacetylchitobiose transporter subunit IIC [Vibrionaceae bacterium]